MRDQASDLRHLVRIDLAQNRFPSESADTPPRIIVVTGGKGGVGTTTIALHLAMAMSQEGQRAVLVDADFNGADATKLCQLEPRLNIFDVLEDRADVHEVLMPGPEGGSSSCPAIGRTAFHLGIRGTRPTATADRTS